MTEPTPPPYQPTEPVAPAQPAQSAQTLATGTAPPIPYGAGGVVAGAPAGGGPVGRIRGTGACIGLSIITLGIYPLVWYYQVHSEMKNHSGQGLGGGVALLLALFVGVAMPFLTASEVGGLYARRGQAQPVSGTTGLWYLPGVFILVGPLVWFVKTNGALNEYWRSQGAA